MDKYERLFADIKKRTQNGELRWEISSHTKYAEHVFNPQYVYRVFDCSYKPSEENTYTLVLVERKDQVIDEYDKEYEKYGVHILVLADNRLVFTLTTGHVDKQSLWDFAEYVEEHSDEAEELFSLFENSEDEEDE